MINKNNFALGLSFVAINVPMLPVADVWWKLLTHHTMIAIGCWLIADGLSGMLKGEQ